MNLELSTPRRRSVMSLTPLIDVVFILLLFFMLASDFSQERSVAWSSVNEEQGQSPEQLLEFSLVYLQTTELYILDNKPITQTSLLEELAARQGVNPAHAVVVSVSAEIDVQTLLSLLATIKKLGITNVKMGGSKAP